MKNFFIKILCIFAFLISFVSCALSSEIYNINSVIFDNSGSILLLNSFDIDDFKFSNKPKMTIFQDEHKAFIDIPDAKLTCPSQNLVISNNKIKQISVVPNSGDNAVRIGFSYDDGFNPASVKLKKLNNSLFLYFNTPKISNFYFQQKYTQNQQAQVLEDLSVEVPVAVQNNTLGIINSAFNQSSQHNYVLMKKNLVLRSKSYINSISTSSGFPVISAIGSYTLSEPIYLTNPNRVAYDVPNSVVNPVIRNKTFEFGDLSVKIGQFEKSVSRVVITGEKSYNYIPVIYPDSQRLVFVDKTSYSSEGLSESFSGLNNVQLEKSDSKTGSVKFIFSKPVVVGFDKTKTSNDLILFNVGRAGQEKVLSQLKKSPFKVKTSELSSDGFRVSFSSEESDNFELYLGSDGKTLRVKQIFKNEVTSQNEMVLTTPEIKIPDALKNRDGKKYIVLDAGHGGSDCGAIRSGTNEKDITLDVTKRVAALLSKKGYVVEMTRTDDSTVSLQDRVAISENIYPDIFVSIHVNSSNSDSPNGIETHYYKDNSIDLAKYIHASMLNHIKANNRGLFKSKFYVINHTTAPAVLVEIGFLSNPGERTQLLTNGRKDATAKAIAEGIDEYFKRK